MPSGLGYALLSTLSTELDRLGVGAGFAQAQDYRDDDPEAAYPPQPTCGPRITLAAYGFESGFVESEDDEEYYHYSIGKAPVIDTLSIA